MPPEQPGSGQARPAADVVNRHWSPLEAAETARLLHQFPQAGQLQGIVWHSARPFSSAAIVETSSGNLFLKRHARSIRSAGELAEEHDFARWVGAHGVPTSEILAATDGRTAIEADEWTYEVHRVAQGVDLYRRVASWEPFQSTHHARSAGRMLARLHRAAAGFARQARQARVLVASCRVLCAGDLIDGIEAERTGQPGVLRYLDSVRDWRQETAGAIGPWHEAARAAMQARAPLWTHNDWHASNLLWTDATADAEVSSVLDFGLSDRTTDLYDLATAVERNVIPWLDIQEGRPGSVDFPALAALLKGYDEIVPLREADLLGLASLLPAVHVDFALSEIDYYTRLVEDREYADLAYDAFLLGHARWFSTAAGSETLAFLRDLAATHGLRQTTFAA